VRPIEFAITLLIVNMTIFFSGVLITSES